MDKIVDFIVGILKKSFDLSTSAIEKAVRKIVSFVVKSVTAILVIFAMLIVSFIISWILPVNMMSVLIILFGFGLTGFIYTKQKFTGFVFFVILIIGAVYLFRADIKEATTKVKHVKNDLIQVDNTTTKTSEVKPINYQPVNQPITKPKINTETIYFEAGEQQGSTMTFAEGEGFTVVGMSGEISICHKGKGLKPLILGHNYEANIIINKDGVKRGPLFFISKTGGSITITKD